MFENQMPYAATPGSVSGLWTRGHPWRHQLHPPLFCMQLLGLLGSWRGTTSIWSSFRVLVATMQAHVQGEGTNVPAGDMRKVYWPWQVEVNQQACKKPLSSWENQQEAGHMRRLTVGFILIHTFSLFPLQNILNCFPSPPQKLTFFSFLIKKNFILFFGCTVHHMGS